MPHHDLYESLRLNRNQTCDQLAEELDNRLVALGPHGGPRVPEMQAARAILGDPSRRTLYDGQLADTTSQPITPSDIATLAAMDPQPSGGSAPAANVDSSYAGQARNAAQTWGKAASTGLNDFKGRAATWSREATSESTQSAREAASKYGAVDATTGRPDVGRRVGALFIDVGIVLVVALIIAISALIYVFNNFADLVGAALGGDLRALRNMSRLWSLRGSASALLPFTALLIALVLVAYCVASEAILGGSLGKKITGLRVVTSTGQSPDISAAAKRNWWPVLFFLPGLGIFLWVAVVIALAVSILTDRQGLSFLDKWAGVAIVPAPMKNTSTNYDWTA